MKSILRTVLIATVMSSFLASSTEARVEIAWGDVHGFTIDGVNAFDHGTATLLAQLIVTPSLPALPDPNNPDGIGTGDQLLASATITVDSQNPNGTFLRNLSAGVGPPLPGENIYLRVFAAGTVATGVRYAETPVSTALDITKEWPQALTFTGAPPATGYGAPPQELNLTVLDPTTNPPAPRGLWLGPAHPNPFNPRTSLTLHVPAAGAEVDVAVFDVHGRRVDTLAAGWFGGGEYSLLWDGTDAKGHSLSSGVYRVRMRARGDAQVQSLVLVR